MGINDVAEAIRRYDNYIIASHVDVEGDAVGSELAVYYLVKQLGKNAVIVNNEKVPDIYRFLPGIDKIGVIGDKRPKGYDNIIVVDCATVERSGRLADFIKGSSVKINIDHHVSNEHFGDFNWVQPDASSCGEMLFNLYKKLGLNINEDIATALYVAILMDTGSFHYDATTSDTHRIAGELLKIGVNPAKISSTLYETKNISEMELLAKVLSTLRLSSGGRISHMYVTKEMFSQTKTMPDETDGFANFARGLRGVEIAVFFRQDINEPQKIHVGFRSKGRVNVNILAGKFGGGGHPKASGCVIQGPLDDVIKDVLHVAEEFLL